MQVPQDKSEVIHRLLVDYDTELSRTRTIAKHQERKKKLITKHKLQYYTLDTEHDIRAVVDKLVAKGEDTCIYPVWSVSDPRFAVRLGLIPKVLKPHVNTPWFLHWLADKKGIYPQEGNADYSYYLRHLEYQSIWCFETLETQRRNAIVKADSSMLLLYAPDLVYKGSKRPKTDMSLFRNPDSLKVTRKDVNLQMNTQGIINGSVTIGGETWHVMPVTRYAAGMKRGLFHGEDRPKEICGTFFYYEPESTTLLAYKTIHTSFNKTTAYIELGVKETDGSGLYYKDTSKEEYPPTRPYMESAMGPNDTIEYADYVGSSVEPDSEDYAPFNIYDVSLLLSHAKRLLSSDLIMNIDEIRNLHQFTIRGGELGTKYYAGELLGLYALEDALDQPLCHAASAKGIDILVFTHMIGSFQVVSEVLDTRSREDSFRSLVYIVD